MIGHPSAPETERPPLDGVAPAAGRPALDEPLLVPPRRRPSTSQWLTLLLGVAVVGLALGAIAAAATGAASRGGVVAAPSGQGGPGARQGAGAALGGGPAGAEAAPGAGAAGAQAGPGAGAARASGAAAAGAGAGGAARGGRPTAGTIASVDGDTLVLDTPDGSLTVQLGDSTSLQKQVPAERADLAPGQRVLVSGERGADGTLDASGVQILGDEPPGGGGGAGGAPGDGAAQRGNAPTR